MKLNKRALPGLLAFALCVCLFGTCAVAYAAETDLTADGGTGGKLVAVNTQATVAAPTTLWVAPSETSGIPSQIDAFKKKTGGTNQNPTYTYQVYLLYLPGNAVLANCFLSWDGGATATVDNTTYESGACPVPPVNTQKSYVFKNGTQTLATLNVITYQGSATVTPVFIEIDETGENPTIAEMDNDADHNVTCTGTICIDGTLYEMPKIKGRGNATWEKAKDKKPYNVTLSEKINFPGIDSKKTKKWSFLAEVLDRSLLCNRSGYSLAYKIGIGQDTASADVWMNGEYQGCYTITPKTDSFVTNDGYMIEQDNYLEDAVVDGGDPQFKLEGLKESSGWSSCYNRITVKKMGDNLLKNDAGVLDESPENMEAAAAKIQSWLQDAWDAIRSDTGYNSKNKYYTDYIDIQSFAKMYLMHEYIKSYDVCAGSILFHRDGQGENDKLIAGPLWDLDNAMGSVYSNNSLGSVADRRSAEGSFIANVTEYKTSIYKTISKHSDFMDEVYRQYNKYKVAFNDLADDTQAMIDDIEASALMNHTKVEDLGNGTGSNNHYYRSNTTLGSSPYKQTYVATTSWPNYAANLKTYITYRSLWFENIYYDPNYVCEHEYEPVVTAPTCAAEGYTTYVCKFCGDSYEGETTPKVEHNYVDGVCTVCGEVLRYVTISCDEHASVNVYKTKDFTGEYVEDATRVHPRNGDTGFIDCGGDGQVNFVVNVDPGYVCKVTAEPTSSYKNLKVVNASQNSYRATKVNNDFTITVTTSAPKFTSHSLLLSGEIGVLFKLEIPEGLDTTDSYMKFAVGGYRSCKVPFEEATEGTDPDTYWFTCFVNALELADTITATYHYATDCEVTNTYSAVGYIEDAKGLYKDDAKLAGIVDSLQNYGHYLQNSGWTDGKDHKAIDEVTKLDETSIAEAIAGVAGYGVTKSFEGSGIADVKFALTLNSKTVINGFFKPEEGVTIVGSTGTPNGETQSGGETYYQFDSGQIGAGILGKNQEISVTTSTEGTATISASPLSYVNAVLSSNAFENDKKYALVAYYNFSEAATAYLAG